MGTGRSDDPFFDHFDDFLYDLMPNKFLPCGSRPVQKRDNVPPGYLLPTEARTHYYDDDDYYYYYDHYYYYYDYYYCCYYYYYDYHHYYYYGGSQFSP